MAMAGPGVGILRHGKSVYGLSLRLVPVLHAKFGQLLPQPVEIEAKLPGAMAAPAQTTGTLTDPAVAFTVPCA
jgi:hypothetical protein